MTGSKNFGAAIRTRRLERKCSLREIARRIGRTAAYLCDLEHGRRGASEATINQLAIALGVSSDWLYWLAGVVPPNMRHLPADQEVVRAMLCGLRMHGLRKNNAMKREE